MGKQVNVNVEHINEVIGLIRDEANFFMLSTYDVPSDIAQMQIDNKVEHLVTSTRSYAAAQVRKYNPVCNTPACIAGWSNFAARRRGERVVLNDSASAARYLGIYGRRELADRLFGLSILSRERDKVTREEAIYALERLRDTGKVPSYRSIRKTLKSRHDQNQSQLHGSQSSGQDRTQDRDD